MKVIKFSMTDEDSKRVDHFLSGRYGRDGSTTLTKLVWLAMLEAVAEEAEVLLEIEGYQEQIRLTS